MLDVFGRALAVFVPALVLVSLALVCIMRAWDALTEPRERLYGSSVLERVLELVLVWGLLRLVLVLVRAAGFDVFQRNGEPITARGIDCALRGCGWYGPERLWRSRDRARELYALARRQEREA